MIFHAVLLSWLFTQGLAGDSGYCGPNTNLCSFDNRTLTNLACGWCRSWTFAANIAGNKLRMVGLDGGALPGDGLASRQYTIVRSLDDAFNLNDLSAWSLEVQPSTIPGVKNSAFWNDRDNTTIYNFGGNALKTGVLPSPNIPKLTISSDAWSISDVSDSPAPRLTAGVNVNVPALQAAFYVGGLQNAATTNAITDNYQYFATNMIIFNTTTGQSRTVSAPFLPRQRGSVSYLPYGTSGVLVYFGGVSPPSAKIELCDSRTNCKTNDWNEIWIYDIAGDQWHQQNATGSATARSEYCVSSMYDQETKSWQIWALGGENTGTAVGMDTVSILSIPSFQWFKGAATRGRLAIVCEKVGPQIFVMGGIGNGASISGNYDSPAYIYDANKQAVVTTYAPTSTVYTAPASIRTAIASSSTPVSWANDAVQSLFATASSSLPAGASGATTPTSSSPAASGTAASSGAPAGAIAGGVVGGVAALAIIAGLVAFFVIRRKKQARDAAGPTTYPKAEMEQPPEPTYHTQDYKYAEMPTDQQISELSGGKDQQYRYTGPPNRAAAHEKPTDAVIHELAS